jgi:hypothetical protein
LSLISDQQAAMVRDLRGGGELEYDPESRTYVLDYRASEYDELAAAVVAGVSELAGVPAERIDLNAVVHPGALNRLFERRRDGTPREGGRLAFRLEGCEVVVTATAEIRLDPPTRILGE